MRRLATKGSKIGMIVGMQICAIVLVLVCTMVVIHTDIQYQYGTETRRTGIELTGEETEFAKSRAFENLFEEDYHYLIYYLAVCKQFEKDGAFDKNATIDILNYVNRRTIGRTFDSKGTLVYQVKDLINWAELDGFSSTSDEYEYVSHDKNKAYQVNDVQLTEMYLPANGTSIYGQDLASILMDAGIMDETGKLLVVTDSELNTPIESWEVDEEALEDAEMAEEAAPAEASEEAEKAEMAEEAAQAEEVAPVENVDNAQVDAKPATENAVALQKQGKEDKTETENAVPKEVLEARARTIVTHFIMQAAQDLAENYYTYANVSGYFKDNTSFVYCYVNQNELYSNCKGSAAQIQDIFENTVMSTDKNVGIKYDLGNDEIETHGYFESDPNHTDLRRSMHLYAYSFQDKGTLYVAYLGDDASKTALGIETDGKPNSKYDKARYVFDQVKPYLSVYVALIVVFATLLFVLFVLFSFQIGKYAVKTEEGYQIRTVQKEELANFDTWYTGIAFLVACCVIGCAIACIGVPIAFYVEDTFLIEQKLLYAMVAFGTFLTVSSCLFFYTSLIKRIRTKTLFSNTVLGHMFGWIKRMLKALVHKASAIFVAMTEKNTLLGICLPFFAFLIYNAVIISFFGGITGSVFVGFSFAFLADMVPLAGLIILGKETDNVFAGIKRIADGEIDYKLDETKFHFSNATRAKQVNQIGDGIERAIEQSRKDERLKADLITNVSHDIKTPLTSIINYVDLLKRTNITDETALSYIDVLAEKSQRLKQLTIDLVEASKISSGNITIAKETVNVSELCKQAVGEYSDKLSSKSLTLVESYPEEDAEIMADPRHMWRILDNLFGNICKYAMPNTRVYLDVKKGEQTQIILKNISECELNFAADELTERFIRGDLARTTEGSGLGLSIAKSLVIAQGGQFEIKLDGDLFKVTITF